ncbi:sugar isomerase [Phyllosticta citribraziliensis]|uniref:Sugar isomerase n=1 Tax=Phyllosticta citribraziliensis TaxID=989973 RepID=A0ABR1LHS4_9PEZI
MAASISNTTSAGTTPTSSDDGHSSPRSNSGASDSSTTASLTSAIAPAALRNTNYPTLKRKCSVDQDLDDTAEALTPPLSATDDDCQTDTPPTLSRALHVLATEATALSNVARLYETSRSARAGLLAAVDIVESTYWAGGKLVVCGVGKSGLVGRKTVATMKSLGLGASFLHAAEAVHGDLGDVREDRDAVLFISFSGKTAELVNLLPHIGAGVPVMALTGHADFEEECPLLVGRRRGTHAVLLPAPIHESEEKSFGVSAPTTSTTVAMAVGDMLAITAAERIHDDDKGRVFRKNHPGGAIGARTAAEGRDTASKRRRREGSSMH